MGMGSWGCEGVWLIYPRGVRKFSIKFLIQFENVIKNFPKMMDSPTIKNDIAAYKKSKFSQSDCRKMILRS